MMPSLESIIVLVFAVVGMYFLIAPPLKFSLTDVLQQAFVRKKAILEEAILKDVREPVFFVFRLGADFNEFFSTPWELRERTAGYPDDVELLWELGGRIVDLPAVIALCFVDQKLIGYVCHVSNSDDANAYDELADELRSVFGVPTFTKGPLAWDNGVSYIRLFNEGKSTRVSVWLKDEASRFTKRIDLPDQLRGVF